MQRVPSDQTSYNWPHYIKLKQRKPGALRDGTPFLDQPAPLLRLRQSYSGTLEEIGS